MRGIRRLVQRHGVWLVATLVVAIVVMALTGWWWILIYAGFNAAGTVLYIDGLDPRTASTRRRRRALTPLTVALVPVGVCGLLASKEGVAPIDASLGDEKVRNQVPGSALYGRRGGGR